MAPADDGEGPENRSDRARPISALPSVEARVLAFAAIAVAGVFGGLIGYSTVKVGCHGDCSTPEGIGGVVGAMMASVGVAVIAVLVLRAMGEWRTIKQDRALEMVTAAATAFRQTPSALAPPPASPEPESKAEAASPGPTSGFEPPAEPNQGTTG